jgi:RNA polymerase sigma factor for flagellar operon FliA
MLPLSAAHAPAEATTVIETAEIETYLPLVHQQVARFLRKLPPNVLREDLVAAGMIGLIDSLRKNGKDRGPAFEWYARIRIRGAILDELRAEDWLSRRARAKVTQAKSETGATVNTKGGAAGTFVRLDDLLAYDSNLDFADAAEMRPCALLESRQDMHGLLEAVKNLPERERFIITAHYLEGVQMKVIAKQLGVSEPRVSQIHTRAVERLRTALTAAEEKSSAPNPNDRPTIPVPGRRAA